MDGDRIVQSRISGNDWLIIEVKQKDIVIYENGVTNISEIHMNNLNKDSPNIMVSESGYSCVAGDYDEPRDTKLFVGYTYLESNGKIIDQGRTYVNTDPKSWVKDWIDYITRNAFNTDKGLVITRDVKSLSEPKPYINIHVDKDGYIEIVCKKGGNRCLK